MLPAPPTKKPNGFYDTESYPNFWLLRLKIGVTHYAFRLDEGQTLSLADRQVIGHLFDIVTSVSFNGIGYDVPMICAALSGYTTEQLYWLTGEIIGDGLMPGKKHWELNLPMNWQPSDHIDIMEVLPGAGSQKMFAGRIHYHTMRDLPYEPTKILSEDEKLQVIEYCGNDLGQLEAEFNSLDDQIDQRIALAERYGNGTIDFRSKSDAQCAEAAIRWKCEQTSGRRIWKEEPDWNLRFPYEPPAFLSFSTPQMIAAFETIKGVTFRLGASGAVEMPESIQGLHIGIGKGVYRMGIGGLHSSEKRQAFVSNDTHVLRDIDVASYYPSLILNSGKFPKALGEAFAVAYQEIKDNRLKAKQQQSILSERLAVLEKELKDAKAEEGIS